MVLCLDLVHTTQYFDRYTFRWEIHWILYVSNADSGQYDFTDQLGGLHSPRDHPYQVLVLEILAHQ